MTMGPEHRRGSCPTGTKGADPRTEHFFSFVPYVNCFYVALVWTQRGHHVVFALTSSLCSNMVLY